MPQVVQSDLRQVGVVHDPAERLRQGSGFDSNPVPFAEFGPDSTVFAEVPLDAALVRLEVAAKPRRLRGLEAHSRDLRVPLATLGFPRRLRDA